MIFKKNVVALGTALLLSMSGAFAAGTLIPSSNRVDMSHDAARNIIYITDANQVLRYHLTSGSFLSPIVLVPVTSGGSKAQLKGIDLSPDGNTLVVADQTSDSSSQWVYLINLNGNLTGPQAISKVSMQKEFMENGMWSVAYAGDGSIFASSQFAGSGTVPLRRLDPATFNWSKLGTSYPENIFSQNTMLSASGNGAVVAFAESNSSAGPWGLYDVVNNNLKRFNNYQTGTSAYNYEIATNSNGTQFAIPTYFGTQIFGANYAKQGVIGQYAGPQPIGVAYHPVENLIYFPWSETREVKAYDSNTLQQVASYDFEDNFISNGNNAYKQGRTKLSRDGSILMVTVTGGVRFIKMYDSLRANTVTATNTGEPMTLNLQGSIGNKGKLTYKLATNPAHGTASVSGSAVSYIPTPGYKGSDSFIYTASYGNATVKARVVIKAAPK